VSTEALGRFSPITREWFASTFAAPTSAQAAAWDAIADQKNTLVIAPTGSGKTLAAFLWALDSLASAADRPANKAFLAAWNKEYAGKATPDFLSAHGWDGMSAVFDLIKETKGKFTGDEAIKFLTNWKTANSPRGPIVIDAETRNVIQTVYLRRVEKRDGKLYNVEFDKIENVKDPVKARSAN